MAIGKEEEEIMGKDPVMGILQEMFRRVGLEYSPDEITEFTKDPNWYMNKQWLSKEEEEDFIKWLTNHLYKSAEVRKGIMRTPLRNKKHCEKTAREFWFMYGWSSAPQE